MTGLERIAVEALAALFLIWGTVLYLEHRGAEKCLDAQSIVVEKAKVNNAGSEMAQIKADVKAETRYADTIQQPLAPLPALPGSLSAPSCPSPMPKAPATPGAGDYRPTIRAPTSPSVVPEGWAAFERSDVQSARDADAEVIYLQSLLASQYRLCAGLSK